MHPRASELIEQLHLTPHPEGGWYTEVFRDSVTVPHPLTGAPRAAMTHIFFLLVEGTFSALHRVRQSELWQFVEGEPLELTVMREEPPRVERVTLGAQSRVHVVPPNAWQAAVPQGAFTLCSCTVAPGFDFADFELPPRRALVERFPSDVELIVQLTRADG